MAHTKGWLVPGRHTEARAPHGGRCDDSCVKPTPSQAHCSVCGTTFGGVWAFDQHRSNGWCLDPAKIGYAPDSKGVWRKPMTDEDRKRRGFVEVLTLPGL